MEEIVKCLPTAYEIENTRMRRFIFRQRMQWLKLMYKKRIVENITICIVNDFFNILLLRIFSDIAVSGSGVVMMKGILLLALVYVFRGEAAVVVRSDDTPVVNDRPIIGVLSQEQSFHLRGKYPEENYTSYIAASYVKDVESSGARVVPVMIGKDRAYYENLMKKINGVLFPGGATYFNQSNGFADAGQHIYEIAMQFNDEGDYFPVFGTCLGFELLIILASGRGKIENRVTCDSFENVPLSFTDDFRDSKMFEDAPDDVVDLLANEDITVNAHQFCILDENLKSHNLTEDWKVTSHSNDNRGVEFVATIEHKRYPIYGVQFHPEKPAFEWKLSKKYAHSKYAVTANRYFMDFFVNECRKSTHTFAHFSEENAHLIYNYEPHFTGILGSAFEQCYMFEPRGVVSK